MKQTTNLGLSLYESADKFAITSESNSLNHNMELIDEAISNIVVPTKTSELENDSNYLSKVPDEYITETELNAKNYLTSYTETDPTVPAWAKQPNKPVYSASEVGADSAGTASNEVITHNTSINTHNDIRIELSSLANKLNAFLNSDDTTLDELSELITAIKNNQNTISQLTSGKVNVSDIINNLTTNVSNKPLSAAQGVALKALIDAIVVPTKVSELTNDKGYLTTVPVTSVNSKTGAITLTASDVGAVTTTKLNSAVNTALAAAKASGEFDGKDGSDGYTPIKGVDYYTESDKSEFSEYIASELAKRGQLKPEYANSVEECTDTSRLYVLPDGLIYAYILTEKEVESGLSYTNKLPSSTDTDRVTIFGEDYNGDGVKDGYINGKRLSSSSGSLSDATGMCASGFIFPVSEGSVIRIKGTTPNQSATGAFLITYDSSNTLTKWVEIPKNTDKSDWSTTTSKSYYRYDATNNEITVTLDSTFGTGYNAIRFSAGTMSADTIVTVDEEIKEGGGTTTVTEYAWVSTGHAFVPADYEDRIIALEEKNSEQDARINDLANDVKYKTLMFISPNGDDSNNGLTSGTPKKTVKACVSAGATRISAQRGVYDEVIQLDNIGELEIFPTDNDKEFVLGENREPIVFEKVDRYTPSDFEAYNSIKRMAYSNADNTQFDKVFTKRSQPTVIGDGYGSRYNSTIWLLSSDEKTVCEKLKPVLTLAECEEEINTFTYVDGYIYINADMTNVEQVVVPMAWETGFRINKAQKIVLREVHVRFSGSYNIDLRNCAYFDLYKCACKYTSYGSGFHPFNSNGVMTSCYATKNFDGYGISEHGHTTYIDCVAEFNFDDGMSHHNACEGTVIGGRYEGNGKGGNTPAPGTKVNIYGGIYKNNGSFGIGYLSDTDAAASGMVQGVLMVGNPKGLIVQGNCSVTAISCVFKDNTQDKLVSGDFTEY